MKRAAGSREEPDGAAPQTNLAASPLPEKKKCVDGRQSLLPETSHPFHPSSFQSWHSTGSSWDFHLRQNKMPNQTKGTATTWVPGPGVPLILSEPTEGRAPTCARPPLRRPGGRFPPASRGGMPPASSPPLPPASSRRGRRAQPPEPSCGGGGAEPGRRAATCTISPSALSVAPAREKRPVRPVVYVV